MIIEVSLLDEMTARAKSLPRLWMDYDSLQSLDEKCYHLLNAVELGTVIPIHWASNEG